MTMPSQIAILTCFGLSENSKDCSMRAATHECESLLGELVAID